MDLKFRRNIPLLLVFVATLALLVLGLGNQPIIAYTVEKDAGQSRGLAAIEDGLMAGFFGLFGQSSTERAGTITQELDAADLSESGPGSDLEVEAALDQTVAVGSEQVTSVTNQIDEE